jgi:HAD superfamily hydrolase (TIGR01509 family)
MFRDLQAVIFDMDGVLLLSNACHDRAYRLCLAEVGITEFSYERVAGMRTDEAFREILTLHGRAVSSEELQALTTMKQRRVLELMESAAPLAPAGAALMAGLRGRFRLALASSGSRQRVGLFLRQCGYADAFEAVTVGEDVPRAKPSPDIYLLTAEKLGVRPEACVVVEDAVSGVEAAVSAGMQVIAVTADDDPELHQARGAAICVRDLEQVSGLLLPV